jgi:hypothetical protein
MLLRINHNGFRSVVDSISVSCLEGNVFRYVIWNLPFWYMCHTAFLEINQIMHIIRQ